MTTDQERAIDAISFRHGGWAASEAPPEGVLRVTTGGDQPNYRVRPDGTVIREEEIEGRVRFPRRWTLEEWLLEVYDPG